MATETYPGTAHGQHTASLYRAACDAGADAADAAASMRDLCAEDMSEAGYAYWSAVVAEFLWAEIYNRRHGVAGE